MGTDLNYAFTLASNAESNREGSASGLCFLQATDDGQNQIYIGTTVPLPPAAASGLVLLVAVAGFKAYRKMATA